MECIEYKSGEKPRLSVAHNDITTLVKTTPKAFAGTASDAHFMLNAKKLIIYNKSPCVLKFVQRVSLKTVDIEASGVIVHASLLHHDMDIAIVVTESGSVELLRAQEMPNSELSPSTTKLPTAGVAVNRAFSFQQRGTSHATADPMAGKAIIGLNANSERVILTDLGKGSQATASNFRSETPIEPLGALSVNFASGLVAVPCGHQGRVSLVDAEDFKPLIEKPWFPHDEGCSSTFIFSSRAATGAAAEHLLTANKDKSELRLWAVAKGGVTLLQTVSLCDADIPEDDERVVHGRRLVLDRDEDYVFLSTTADKGPAAGQLIVAELSDDRSHIRRITDWQLTAEPILSLGPILRRVGNKSTVTTDMSVITRTTTSVVRLVLDANKLDGAPNVGVEGEEAAAADQPQGSGAAEAVNVKKWFAAENATPASAASATPGSSTTITTTMSAANKPTAVTSVVPDPHAAERLASEAVAQQQRHFMETLHRVNTSVTGMERRANDQMSLLRSAELQNGAQAAGRTAGTEAASEISRLVANQQHNARGGQPSSSLLASPDKVTASEEALASFNNSVRQAVLMTAGQSVAQQLQANTASCVERSWSLVSQKDNAKREEIPAPKMSSLPSMQVFMESVDKAHSMQNDLFRRQKEQEAIKCRAITAKTVEAAEAKLSAGRSFLEQLRGEVTGLGRAIEEAKVVVAAPSAAAAVAGPAPKENEDTVFATAEKLAHEGQWKLAVQKVLQFGSLALTIRFLSTDLAKSSRELISSPTVLSFASFMTLMRHLSHSIQDSPGLLPLRLDWMYHVAMGMDGYLDEPPTTAEENLINNAGADFSNLVDALDAIDVKGTLDSTSRRHFKLVKKILASHGL